MASGKSLELAGIARKPASLVCKCGQPWDAHKRKDGQLLAKYDNSNHEIVKSETKWGNNRANRRKMGLG